MLGSLADYPRWLVVLRERPLAAAGDLDPDEAAESGAVAAVHGVLGGLAATVWLLWQ
jgi:hypothetical protein